MEMKFYIRIYNENEEVNEEEEEEEEKKDVRNNLLREREKKKKLPFSFLFTTNSRSFFTFIS